MFVAAVRSSRLAVTTITSLVAILLATVFATVPAAAQQTDPGTRQYAAAVALHNKELWDLAATEWTKFVEEYPKHDRAPYGHHYLGVCQFKLGQLAAAEKSFAKVVADYPKFDRLEAAYLYLGLSQFSQGRRDSNDAKDRYAEAAATFAKQAEQFPDGRYKPQALYYQGECHYARGELEKAIPLYEQVVEKHPRDPLAADALYALGVAQEELKRWEAAGETYGKFLNQYKDSSLAVEVGMRFGETLFARGQYSDAEKWFAQAARSEGFAQADHATLRQAASLSARKRYGDAAQLYASVAEKFPGTAEANLAVARMEGGKCYYLAEQYAKARELLQRVLDGSTPGVDKAEAAHWIARGYLREKQPGEALRVVEAGLSREDESPYRVSLLLDKADALYELPDRRKESVAAYADIAERFPEDNAAPQARYMAAFAAMNAGDYAAAISHAEKFLADYEDHSLTPDVMYVAGESHLQRKEYAVASEKYRALLEKYPSRMEAENWKLRLGLSLHLAGKHQETIDALASHVAEIQSPPLRAEAWFLIGYSQNELKDYAAATESLENSLKADSDWRQADQTLLTLAYAYRQTGDLNGARSRLARLIEDFPKSELLDQAHYRLGDYAYEAGDFATAQQEYAVLAKVWPKSELIPHALYGLGWSHISQSDPHKALQPLTELIEGHPKHELAPRARYARGLARQKTGQFAVAVEDLQAFLSAEPDAEEAADARYALALCLVEQDKPAEAETALRTILKEQPDYAGADKVRYELAWALKSQDKAQPAAAMFAELAERSPNSSLAPEALYHVGESLYDEEKFAEAAEAYLAAEKKLKEIREAGKIDEKAAAELGEKATHKLAWTAWRRDQFDKAERNFAYQLATYPQGELAPDARFMQGEALFKQGNYTEALKLYETAGDLSSEQFEELAALHSAQAANQLEQYQKGLDLVKPFPERFPESQWLPEALYERAWSLQHLGQSDEALKVYEEVTAKTNREVAAKARFMIGEIHFANKDHSQAVRDFFKVAYGYGYATWQANALYEAGRCLEVLEKKEQARKLYEELLEKFPESDKASLAKKRVAELGP